MKEGHTQVRQQILTIPEIVKLICQELDANYDKTIAPDARIIFRQDILKVAENRGINRSSVTIADYCDNGLTSQYSNHSFLHRVKPGRYILNVKA